MQYYLNDNPVENVYHVKGTAEWTATSLDALGTAFENWENTTAKVLRGDSCQLHAVIAIALFAEDGPIAFSSVAIDGTHAFELLPSNVTLAVKWTTAHRGRSFRGRSYWIGLTVHEQSSTDPNQIDPAQATNILNAYNTLLITALPNGGQMVVLSYANDCTWRTTGLATPITKVSLTDPIFDSQRRRLPAHNIHH